MNTVCFPLNIEPNNGDNIHLNNIFFLFKKYYELASFSCINTYPQTIIHDWNIYRKLSYHIIFIVLRRGAYILLLMAFYHSRLNNWMHYTFLLNSSPNSLPLLPPNSYNYAICLEVGETLISLFYNPQQLTLDLGQYLKLSANLFKLLLTTWIATIIFWLCRKETSCNLSKSIMKLIHSESISS